MSKQLFMGVDIGTSGVRAALFDLEGTQIGLYHKEYPMLCSLPGMGELNPQQIFDALLEVIKICIQKADVTKEDIEAIGFSTQMHSLMAVDSEGNCLTNVLTWADSRPLKDARFIEENFDCGLLYHKTGCRVQHPMYPLSKILWLKNNEPDLFRKVHKFITIKEYIIYKLCGEFLIDITDASATACFNIHNFQWDDEILKNILGVDKEKFGTPVECTHILKGVNAYYADVMGIDQHTPIVIGSGDGIMANVGCGVFDDTAMSFTIGTSGALRIAVDKPLLDPQQRTWCYCFTKDTWVAGGAINNGGIVLKWLRDEYRQQYEYDATQVGISNIYKLFDHYAAQITPGSDGLIFLPHLTGERSPGWNASAKGTIHGLQLMHGRKHLVRAAMEGVMFKMYSIYEAITQINDNIKVIMANGGYVSSDIWLQMQADIFNKEIAVAGIGEAAAFGAAYVAMVAVGAVSSLKEPLPAMKPARLIKPMENNHTIYAQSYKQFKELYNKIY